MNATEKIDKYIEYLPAWKKALLDSFRKFILEQKPDIIENWKWEVPVWSGKKPIAAASDFKDHVKFNFFNGASLVNTKLFNSGLDSKKHRSINIKEGEIIDEDALKKLIAEAINYDSN